MITNAKYIDNLIETRLRSYNQRLNRPVSDEVFVRRAYLKIIGRIPSYSETKAFLSMRGSDRKTKLIDSLLLTEGYVSHWFHFWADILRAKENFGNRMSGRPYIDYIKEFIAMNRPYDEWVKEMLSSTGAYWEKETEALAILREIKECNWTICLTLSVFSLEQVSNVLNAMTIRLTDGLKSNFMKWPLTLKVQEICVVAVLII